MSARQTFRPLAQRSIALFAALLCIALLLPAVGIAQGIDGVGPKTAASIPANSSQAVVVVGESKSGDDKRKRSTSAVTLWEKVNDGWVIVKKAMPARNGHCGWKTVQERKAGDFSSPCGVFTLTDGGGLFPKPDGTKISYEDVNNAYHPPSYSTMWEGRKTTFDADGNRNAEMGTTGFPMDETFGYGVVVNFNRPEGIAASNGNYVRPLGPQCGDDIWLHVTHGAPTAGCVTLPKEEWPNLLQWLDPVRHPVVIMGDKDWLAQ